MIDPVPDAKLPLLLHEGVTLHAEPGINEGFYERGEYRFTTTHPGAEFYVDDEPLARSGQEWIWCPGFYAGTVTAELVVGTISQLFLLKVSPKASKLDDASFERMFREVLEEAPDLIIGDEPAQMRVGGRGAHDDPRIQFALVRRYGELFCRALDAIAAKPLMDLARARQLVQLNMVRRADRQTALAAVRRGYLPERDYTVRDSQHWRFDVPEPRAHADAAANRCIASIAVAVRRRIAQVREHMGKLSSRVMESETKTELSVRWPRRAAILDDLRRALDHRLTREPFRSVTRLEVSSAGLNAVSADPAYARAYRLGWRILSARLDDEIGQERLWISPTWEIFERWCFVRLGRVLQEQNPHLSWSMRRAHPSGATAALQGHVAEERQLELLLQPVFPAGDQPARYGFRSVSGERCPDIVFTERVKDEERFMVFDAKYSAERSDVLRAMAPAHIYQDCLRWNGRRADRSLIVVPRGGGASWLEDPYLHDRERSGVIELSFDAFPRGLFERRSFTEV